MFTTIVLTCLAAQPVTPLHTYNNINNGIMIRVDLEEGVDVSKLYLLDHENNQLAKPVTVTNGTHDLVSRIPAIKNLTTAAWVQTLVSGVPVGSPIVVQPMTSRKVPIVEEATRSDGKTKYTKIVGWKDEAEEDGLKTPFVSGWRVYIDQEVNVETIEGTIRVSLRPDAAPNTVWNFRELVAGDFYQNTTFHRIVPMTSKGHPFVIQGGDPTGSGSGGPGYWLPIEHSQLPHDFGVISMARANDPDSAGSQFFFCLSREGTARLDGQYCSFGETIEGGDVIKAIATSKLADPATGSPIHPPQIKSITLVAAPSRTPSSQK
jgi:peptidyl-prolyl cis-trans isomerase B (cyclophilin B)